MSTPSEQAAIEVRIDREINGIRHRVRQYLEKVNFWRDILPGTLALQLPESSGDWISASFTAGELVPPWSAANIHKVKRTALRLARNNGPRIEIHAGRHYPRYLAAGTADIYAGNGQPMRIVDMDANSVTIDLNHPLARCTPPVKPTSFPGNRLRAPTTCSTRYRAWCRTSTPRPVNRSGNCMAARCSRACRYST